MDYSRILATDFSPFRLHVLDVVVLLHEHHNYPFASERNCVRTAQLVWVTPTYMPNNIRDLYRECAELQARTADRAYPPRIIFREPPLMAAAIMAWATVRSTVYEETDVFIELLDRALMGRPVPIPAGYEGDSQESGPPSRDEQERLQDVQSPPPFSPITEDEEEDEEEDEDNDEVDEEYRPPSPPPSYDEVCSTATPPPAYNEVVAPANNDDMVDLTEDASMEQEDERRDATAGDRGTEEVADSSSEDTRNEGAAPADVATGRALVQQQLRGNMSLPLRPLALLDSEGRIMASQGRYLPYSAVPGQLRPPSPRTSQLGRIRISRTGVNRMTSELLPPATPATSTTTMMATSTSP